jgi:hypothetical protein
MQGAEHLQNAAVAYTEAGFAGLASYALARLSVVGFRNTIPKLNPQLFNPPRDSYPWTPKGIWNRIQLGEPGQRGVGFPRQVPKLTALAGLALIGIGGAVAIGLITQHQPLTLSVIPPIGTQAYPQPLASGQPLASFPQFTPLDPTGLTKKDASGTVWEQVTWRDSHGKLVTGWVKATDAHRLSVVPAAGNGVGANIYSGPSLPSTKNPGVKFIGVFAPNTRITPTGRSQTDSSGNLWVEVKGSDRAGDLVTGWVEAQYVH